MSHVCGWSLRSYLLVNVLNYSSCTFFVCHAMHVLILLILCVHFEVNMKRISCYASRVLHFLWIYMEINNTVYD